MPPSLSSAHPSHPCPSWGVGGEGGLVCKTKPGGPCPPSQIHRLPPLPPGVSEVLDLSLVIKAISKCGGGLALERGTLRRVERGTSGEGNVPESRRRGGGSRGLEQEGEKGQGLKKMEDRGAGSPALDLTVRSQDLGAPEGKPKGAVKIWIPGDREGQGDRI